MKISKKDALAWFEYLSNVNEDIEYIHSECKPIIDATLKQIERTQIKKITEMQASIPELQNYNGRTYYLGDTSKFPVGCRFCLTGDGLTGVRKTNECNLVCKFCYYHDTIDEQEGMLSDEWEIEDTRYEIEDIKLMLDIYKKDGRLPRSVAYVYLEPFLEIEKYYDIIKLFHSYGIYQHMYTNGTLCTKDNLTKLAASGLDELRFNLGATACSSKVIENMRLAVEVFANSGQKRIVGIETPMTPEFYDSFMKRKQEILTSGITFINCAELHFGPDNLNNYSREKIYTYKRGYVSPLWSREITYKLMMQAQKSNEDWNGNYGVLLHDCSNYTKYARELNKASKRGDAFGSTTYVSEFDRELPHIFLAVLRDEEFKFLEEEELPEEWNLDEWL